MAHLPQVTFHFVNDGSNDNTSAILHEFVAGKPNCRVHDNEENVGKANAIRTGFLAAIQEDQCDGWLAFLDSDGSISLSDIVTLCRSLPDEGEALSAHTSQVFAIFPSRINISEVRTNNSRLRKVLGRVAPFLLHFGWRGSAPLDTQTGFKIFRNNELFRSIIQVPFKTRWMIEWEIILRAGNNRLRIETPNIDHWHHVSGSKIRGTEVLRVIHELLTIKFMQFEAQIRPRKFDRSYKG
jgi:dolichyl-phosphate beta-glucosyltransferase